MLQHATPSAPHNFSRPTAFAEAPSRSQRGTVDYDIPQQRDVAGHRSTRDEQQRRVSDSELGERGELQHQLPALSALASLAANAPAAATMNHPNIGGDSTRSSTPSNAGYMSTSQIAPAATAGGNVQSNPSTCANCSTSTTPLWRRDESGSILCNACGLFLKLHGRPRPISLKTDVIKSRNRVKTSQSKKRDSQGEQDGLVPQQNGYPAAHLDAAHVAMHAPPPPLPHTHISVVNGDPQPQLPSPTSGSRSNTPNLSRSNSQAAQSNVFDTVSLPSDSFSASPSLPPFAFLPPRGATSTHAPEQSSPLSPAHDALVAHNKTLRTRVSELEVINDLFRGRVAELETSEQQARRCEQTKESENQTLRADLAAANARAADLERKLAALQEANCHDRDDDGPAPKRRKSEREDSALGTESRTDA